MHIVFGAFRSIYISVIKDETAYFPVVLMLYLNKRQSNNNPLVLLVSDLQREEQKCVTFLGSREKESSIGTDFVSCCGEVGTVGGGTAGITAYNLPGSRQLAQKGPPGVINI